MKEPLLQTLEDDDATLVVNGEEATLVSPRFDDEETLVARPVVPLEAEAASPQPEPAPTPRPEPYRPHAFAPRRSGVLALVLVSVFVGGVLGGAGLYLYQRQNEDSPANTGATAQPETPADDAAGAAPAPAAENQNAAPPAEPQTRQPDAQASDAPKPEAPSAPEQAEKAPSARAREAESVPAVERREAPREGVGTVAPKRGKKDARDREIERRADSNSDGNIARADDAPREARRVDSIFYRQRRAERRARRGGDVDRLRRIFEGAPE